MPATRVGPAAAHALQFTLHFIFVLLPLIVPFWAILSFVLVPTAARGLRNTDSTPGPRWLKRPLALVSLPLKLAAGLAWLLYAAVTLIIHPFALLAYELLRLCTRPTLGAGRAGLVQVAPADGGPTIDVKVQGRPTVPTSHNAPPEQGIDHNAHLYSVEERGGPPEQGPAAKPRVGLKGLRRGLGASGVLTDSMDTVREKRNRYTRFDSVWTALEGRQASNDQDTASVRPGDVRLLSANWLAERAKKGEPLSRRQELPEEAFLSVAQLKAIQAEARPCFNQQFFWDAQERMLEGKGFLKHFCSAVAALFQLRNERNVDNLLPIIAISYCWLEAAHPDRDGRQLQLMFQKLQALYGGRGLLGTCRDYGFSDMGVFLDWGSLHQKDPELFDSRETPEAQPEAERAAFAAELKAGRRFYGGERYAQSRSEEEQQAFGRGLKQTMDLWYSHAGITVVLLTRLPEGHGTARSYESRGWTTFERCSAELGKSFSLTVAKWKLIIDTGHEEGDVQRRLPTAPARMAELLESRRFTNNADKQGVLELYKKTASAVLGTVEGLDFSGMPLVSGDEWCSPEQLSEALNLCSSLQNLFLHGTRLTDKGVEELVGGLDDGALPALTTLWCNGIRFSAEGITTLCNAFGHGLAPKLARLHFADGPFGDAHMKALAAAFSSGRMPESFANLYITNCDVGDQGAIALAAALLESGVACQVVCGTNHIGLAGQSALLQALEAKHGASLAGYVSVAFAQAPALSPPFLQRALACGVRYNWETRGVNLYL